MNARVQFPGANPRLLPTTADRDDRVTCVTCRRLVNGHCSAYEAVGAARGYMPVREILRRCSEYRGRGG